MFSTSSSPSGEIPCKLQDYTVLEFLGEGVFGQVAKCFNPKTGKVVAVKILKDDQGDMQREVKILQHMNVRQPDKVNIVKLIDHFTWGNFKCMAFEMLDCSLLHLLRQRQNPLSLCEIRPITQQLLVAFEALGREGVIHADLKPDNIMLVNHREQPFKVKLIDFGCGGHKSELELGMPMQPGGYRAPEVTLGSPLSEAVDMWSLGCCLGEAYLGCYLFSASSSYDNLRTIMQLLEQPSDEMLNKGIYTERYFVPTNGPRQWRFKGPMEYQLTNGKRPDIYINYPLKDVTSLDDAIASNPAMNDDEYLDLMAFLDLLKQLLRIDPEKRITPGKALQHPFITMEHLTNSQYAERARVFMALAVKDSKPAPGDDTKEDPVKSNPQPPAAAPQCQVSSLASGNCDSYPEGHKHPSEMSHKPDAEGTNWSSREFEYIDNDEYGFLKNNVSIHTKDQCDDTEEDSCTRPTECINVKDFTEDPDLRRDEDHNSCHIEMDTRIETDINIEPRLNEDGAAKPDYVIEMGDCSEDGPRESNTSGSRMFNRFSFWSTCKGLVFGGFVALQAIMCYALSGFPLLAGVVVLPMLLHGCVDFLTTRMNWPYISRHAATRTTPAISRRPPSSTPRGR